MKITKIDHAVSEAKRFLRKAAEAKKRLGIDEAYHYMYKETAAMKRASMDLTRALAELRKP